MNKSKDYLMDILLLKKLFKLQEKHVLIDTLYVPDSQTQNVDKNHLKILIDKGYLYYMDNSGESQSGLVFTTKGTQAKWYLYEDIIGLLFKSIIVPILVTLITLWITGA